MFGVLGVSINPLFIRRVIALAALLLAGFASAALQPCTQVDILLSDAAHPPDELEAWQPQRLPDEWQRTRPQFSGTAWYRFRAEVPVVPAQVQALYLPRAGLRETRNHRQEY